MALTEIDRNLLKRCLSEEPGAWKDFVDRFMGLFVHVINHTGHARSVDIKREDIDDLCAEVFLALLANDYQVLRNFRGKCSLATYLSVIARRVVVREMTRRRMSEAFGHVEAHQSAFAPEQIHIQNLARDLQERGDFENRDEVQDLLLHLPATDAEIVKAYHLDGKSYREISARLGIPENSIGPTLTRAREKMRARRMQSTGG